MRQRVHVRPRPVEPLLRHSPLDGDRPGVILGSFLCLSPWSTAVLGLVAWVEKRDQRLWVARVGHPFGFGTRAAVFAMVLCSLRHLYARNNVRHGVSTAATWHSSAYGQHCNLQLESDDDGQLPGLTDTATPNFRVVNRLYFSMSKTSISEQPIP